MEFSLPVGYVCKVEEVKTPLTYKGHINESGMDGWIHMGDSFGFATVAHPTANPQLTSINASTKPGKRVVVVPYVPVTNQPDGHVQTMGFLSNGTTVMVDTVLPSDATLWGRFPCDFAENCWVLLKGTIQMRRGNAKFVYAQKVGPSRWRATLDLKFMDHSSTNAALLMSSSIQDTVDVGDVFGTDEEENTTERRGRVTAVILDNGDRVHGWFTTKKADGQETVGPDSRLTEDMPMTSGPSSDSLTIGILDKGTQVDVDTYRDMQCGKALHVPSTDCGTSCWVAVENIRNEGLTVWGMVKVPNKTA